MLILHEITKILDRVFGKKRPGRVTQIDFDLESQGEMGKMLSYRVRSKGFYTIKHDSDFWFEINMGLQHYGFGSSPMRIDEAVPIEVSITDMSFEFCAGETWWYGKESRETLDIIRWRISQVFIVEQKERQRLRKVVDDM